MPIPPECERVPSAGGNAVDPFFVRFYADDGIGRGTFLSRCWSGGNVDPARLRIHACRPWSGDDADGGSVEVRFFHDDGRETMSILQDCGFMPADSDRETMSIPPDSERVSGTGGDAGDAFFARLYLDDRILVEVEADDPLFVCLYVGHSFLVQV